MNLENLIRNLVSHSFLDDNYKVVNWTNFYTELLGQLIDLDQYSIDKILNGEIMDKSLEKCFSRNDKSLRRSCEIYEGIYVECNLSTENKLQVLRKVMNVMDVDLNEASFVIK